MKSICCAVFAIFFSLSVMGKPVELPIVKAVGSLIITKLEIGGKEYKFLLDTGSNANFIEPSSGRSLRKFMERQPEQDTFVNTFGGKQKSEAYNLSLNIKGLKYSNMLSYAMGTSKFSKEQDGIDCCDGILGIDFIKKYPVEVDIKNKVIRIHKDFTLKGKWKRLPIEMKGKNIITFKCSANGDKFNFRLDSGNEVPVIFHTHKVDSLLLREQMFSQGYHGNGLPFFYLKDLKCGEVKASKLLSTYFYGSKGALTHKFVDGNVGSHLLSDHYILDLNNKSVWVRNKALDFKFPGKTYNYIPHFKFSKGHRSIVNQAVSLIVNSCSQVDRFQDCVKMLCSIEQKKLCVFKETRRNFDDFVKYQFPLQTRDCSIPRLVSELRFKPVQYNFCWYKLSEINQSYYPKKFKPVKLEGNLAIFEDKVSILEVSSPVTLTRDFYCYAVSQNIINERTLPASMFGLSVKGLSLSKKSISFYRDWMKTKNGKKCSDTVYGAIGERPVSDLTKYFKKDYLGLVNPYTILGDGVRYFRENYSQTLNHELLHAIYSISPKAKQMAKKSWEALSDKEKEAFKKKHPSYNFEDKTILYREYFAYFYENKTDKLILK
jgi:hypothetical protein